MKAFEVLEEALRLKAERPELDIIFWACGDEMCDPWETPYTAQVPVNVVIDRGWFGPNGEMWEGEEDAINRFRDNAPLDMSDEDVEAGEREALAQFEANAIDAICVRLRAWTGSDGVKANSRASGEGE